MTESRERAARKAFTLWVDTGSRSFNYNLFQLAGGEYASTYTEMAWKAFKAGWIGHLQEETRRTHGDISVY